MNFNQIKKLTDSALDAGKPVNVATREVVFNNSFGRQWLAVWSPGV